MTEPLNVKRGPGRPRIEPSERKAREYKRNGNVPGRIPNNTPPHPDWQQIMLDLRVVGFPPMKLAPIICMSADHIRKVSRGEIDEIRYGQGTILVEIHKTHCHELHKSRLKA